MAILNDVFYLTTRLCTPIGVAFGMVLIGWAAVQYLQVLKQRGSLPPGPFPWPLVGNTLQLSRSKPWLQFQQWSRENRNGLLTIWIGYKPHIICNDAWSASELMEKRSNIYSSRPEYVILGDLTNQATTNIVFMPYNDHWRLQRKTMHSALGSQAIKPYRGFQCDESRVLMHELLTDPAQFAHYFERYACSLVSILGWGRRIGSLDDSILKTAVKMMHDITLVQVPALYWLDTFPALQHLPKWFYPLPAQFRSLGKSLKRFWWALSCEGAERETPNFSHALIKTAEGNGLSQAEIGEMTATLIGGGLDTTSSTLHTLVLALCLFPEVLKRAHDELDRVVGNTAPSWDDLDGGRLPYCAAVLKEAMRWRSVTALGGFAHAPIQDDIYKGYHFPAGIPIFGNVWAMHANPVDFPHPHDFRPERYLDQRQPYPNKIGHSAFGWGRRSCSGQYFAEQSLSQTVARLLWSFDIRPGLDEHGNPVKLDPWAYTDNENTQPLPFKAQFIARNEEIKAHICREAEEGRERLRIYDGETKVTLDQFM